MLEELAGTGTVRVQLAAAIHAWVSLSPAARDRALMRYFRYKPGKTLTRPSESLPESECASAEDFNRAAWAVLAPPSFPFPPNLPTELTFHEVGDGVPPLIYSRIRKGITMHCPTCGRPYSDNNAFRRHLVAKHEWTYSAAEGLAPPGYVRPERAPAEYSDGYDDADDDDTLGEGWKQGAQ
jgi:hypothetical protein